MKMAKGLLDIVFVCLPLNDIVGVFVTDGEVGVNLGALLPPMNVSAMGMANLTISLMTMNVSGLNTFTELSLLETPADMPYSLAQAVGIDEFGVNLHLKIDVHPNQKGMMAGSDPLSESFIVGVDVDKISVGITNFLAMDATQIGDLYVEQLLKSPTCIMDSFYSANATSIPFHLILQNFELKPVGSSQAGHHLEDDLDSFVNVFANTMLDDFSPWLEDFVAGVVQGPVRHTMVNRMINGIVVNAPKTCEPHEKWDDPEYVYLPFDQLLDVLLPPPTVDPKTGEVVDLAKTVTDLLHSEVMQRAYDAFLSPEGLNSYVGCMANKVLDNMSKGNADGSVANLAIPSLDLKVSIKDVFVKGLDSFYELSGDIIDHYTLLGKVGVGKCETNGQCKHPISLGLSIVIDFGETTHDEINIQMSFSELELALELLMKLRTADIMNMKLETFGEVTCIGSSIEEMNLNQLTMSMGEATIDIEINTNSGIAHWIFGGTKTADLLNKIFGAVFLGMQPVVNDMAKQYIESAPEECAQSGTKKPSNEDVHHSGLGGLAFLTVQNIVILVLAILLIYFYRYKMGARAKKRNQDMLDKAIMEKRSQSTIERLQTKIGGGPTDWSTALIFHPDIMPVWRYGVAFVLFFGAILFLVSNLADGATVDLALKLAKDPMAINGLFLFTLGGTIHEMWTAKVYALAIIIAAFSGMFPYMKLLAMAYCWCAPTNKLSVKGRERILMAIDSLGKWSLVDAYVLVLMMVGFNLHIALQQDGVVADVYVNAKFGFYGFLLATMLSLSVGHVIIWFHRYTISYADLKDGGPMISLSEQKQKFGHLIVSMTPLGRSVTSVIIGATLFLMFAGASANSFTFVIDGLAGVALKLTPGNGPKASYSMFSLGALLPYATPDPMAYGVRWIQCTYFAFAFICPAAFMISLFLLWCVRLSVVHQRIIFVCAEVLNAWSALDCFVLSIFAAIAQIGQFAHFMVGDKCDLIDMVMEEALKTDEDLAKYVGKPTCFGVTASLEPGIYLLLLAAIIFAFVGHYLLDMCHRGLEVRIHESVEARETRSAYSKSVAEFGEAAFDPHFPIPLHEEHPHEKAKLTWFLRNLINSLDMLKMLKVEIEGTGERATLGFGIDDIYENDEAFNGFNPSLHVGPLGFARMSGMSTNSGSGKGKRSGTGGSQGTLNPIQEAAGNASFDDDGNDDVEPPPMSSHPTQMGQQQKATTGYVEMHDFKTPAVEIREVKAPAAAAAAAAGGKLLDLRPGMPGANGSKKGASIEFTGSTKKMNPQAFQEEEKSPPVSKGIQMGVVNVTGCRLNKMSTEQLCAAIEAEIGLGMYCEAIADEAIDGPVLVALAMDPASLDEVLIGEIKMKNALHRAKFKAWVGKNVR